MTTIFSGGVLILTALILSYVPKFNTVSINKSYENVTANPTNKLSSVEFPT